MQYKHRLMPTALAVLALVACGGGGGGGSSSSAVSTTGKVVDGYLRFAKVVCDANENGVADTGEDVSFTDTVGSFVFASGCSHSLLASGGVSTDTGLPLVGVLRAPAKSAVVTPLTTLLSAGMTQAQIRASLLLPATTDITATDPAATDASGNLTNATLYKKTLAVQQMLQKTSEMLTSLGSSAGSSTVNSVYGVVAGTVASALKSGSPLLTSDTAVDAAVMQTLVQSATTAVGKSGAVDSTMAANVANTNASAVAQTTSPAYTAQSNAILGSGTTSASVAAVTTTHQSSTFVSDFVSQYKNQYLLSSVTVAQSTLTDLGSAVANSAMVGTSTLDTSLANFEESPARAVTGFGAGADIINVADAPSGGGSVHVLQIARGNSLDFAGATLKLPTGIGFTATRKTISALVYSPYAGVPMPIHVDNFAEIAKSGSTGKGPYYSKDTQANETVVKGWQTLTWTLSDVKIGSDYIYDAIVLTPNLGTKAPSTGELFFYDNIVLKTDQQPIIASNYLSLTDDSMTLVNGSKNTTFTLAQFKSDAGISSSWPLSSSATLNFKLTETGSFSLASGQTVDAAIEISETTGGQGLLKGYVQNVAITKSGSNITIKVPTSALSKIYGVSTTAVKKAIVDFSSAVSGVTSTITSDQTVTNKMNIGDVLQYTTNSLSNQFDGMDDLRKKYKVTIVVSGLPLRLSSGVVYPTMTVNVPTALNADGSTSASVPVTGQGLVGYITLTD